MLLISIVEDINIEYLCTSYCWFTNYVPKILQCWLVQGKTLVYINAL